MIRTGWPARCGSYSSARAAIATSGSSASVAASPRRTRRERGRSSVIEPFIVRVARGANPSFGGMHPQRSAHTAQVSAGIEREIELLARAIDLERIGLGQEAAHGLERP